MRAWIIHSVLTVFRLIFMAFQATSWQRSLANREAIVHNIELVDSIQQTVQVSIMLTTLVGLVLDIACYKWIRIAHALIYVEIIYTAQHASIPFEQGLGASQTLLVLSSFSALCLYCDPIPNFAFLSILVIWLAFC